MPSYEVANYIALAIPIFFLLIGVELLVSKMRKTNLYRFNDAVTNISCGIGQQVIGVFLKFLGVISYIYIYDQFRFFDIPQTLLVGFLLFLGIDFFYYWFHRLAHEISFLWGSHVVHHQSEEYNLTVALRQSWTQNLFSTWFYTPLAFLGFHPIMFLIINQFQTLYQFWIHTRTINKMPKVFEYFFNTPSHHRVHHGVNPKYIDRNHGGTLIIYDRLFGTFQEEEEEVVYGVTQQPNSWNPVWLNVEYWVWLFREAGKTRTWSDWFSMMVREPGWRPDYLGGAAEAKHGITPDEFPKYDTTIPMSLNLYILFQYFFILGGATFFLFQSNGWNIGLKIGVTLLVIISLVNLGGLFEKKPWVWYAEYSRLLISAGGIVALLLGTAYFPMAVVVSIAFLLGSAIWLSGHRQVFFS